MHLNLNFSRGAGPAHFHGSRGGGQSQMGTMMRMMMHMMQQMMQLFTGQAGGQCQMGRPNFGGHGCSGHGGGFQGGHCGNPVGNFLGSPGGFQGHHHHGGGHHHHGPSQHHHGGGHHHHGPSHHHHGGGHAHHAAPTGNWQSGGAGGNWGGKLPGPLQRHAGAFDHYGKKYGVDPKFLAAISMLETGKGTSSAFRNKNNAMGVSNRSGPIAFSSVDQSIERMARVLAKKDGPYAGKRTIGQIAGVYCPVGAGNDVNGTNHHWPSMVTKFYGQLGGNPSVAVKG
jgi:hypothetical protein